MDIHAKIMESDPNMKKTKISLKKRKLQANINDKHRWKNPHKNNSKLKPITHEKNHIP